ncbi:CDP-diacylglycerol-serine O-phosphatidyltransferase [Bacteriovorax sp. BSW11_IV]|uniref:CDP-diacylglycerol--serine O-phosphatidyltransferase n=1 Tax=Bacteriovorax sp. BSW11_IV TaxID=1353529 RepID=UPI00038A221C|nr:CDP-diacylglycerol--serine O-phosphatidyltransferase [Bacteriovorax sp. BSW11_IV]EQC44441.1 CDP-diacylglycerol-serine O-phosphatidyltransferase [Bacteriovorax sp. BSW11_IV]
MILSTPRRVAFFLPNTFTALNMACGFASIIMSWKGDYYNASMILLLGAIFDSVDGRVARITGTQSAFGEQFDSLSDVISFGAAPAFLAYNFFLADFGRLGIVVAFIYLLCGALRLARFNANINKVSSDYFQGLPIPGAALGIIGYVLINLEFDSLTIAKPVAMLYVVFYASLMVSNVPFNSFKKSEWVRKRKRKVLFLIFLILALVVSYERIMVGLLTSIYVFGSLAYYIKNKSKFQDMFEWRNENEDDDTHEESDNI